jgi:hypothetical protein
MEYKTSKKAIAAYNALEAVARELELISVRTYNEASIAMQEAGRALQEWIKSGAEIEVQRARAAEAQANQQAKIKLHRDACSRWSQALKDLSEVTKTALLLLAAENGMKAVEEGDIHVWLKGLDTRHL